MYTYKSVASMLLEYQGHQSALHFAGALSFFSWYLLGLLSKDDLNIIIVRLTIVHTCTGAKQTGVNCFFLLV